MKQSGMAMVEALVAASLLSLGLLGASRLTLRALDAALQTRQLEQAHALAREALDCALLQSSPCPAVASASWQGVAYTVQIEQKSLAPGLSDIAVQVEWRSASGPQRIQRFTRRSDVPGWLGVSSP
jgi:Tfp pilus assembly protein PilV